jgi:U3 small nucleolar RNA-associated protein 7
VDEGEHTLQLKQLDITKNVDISSATKGFHLSLDQFGPYTLRYTTNGRYLALGGRKGHIAAFDWVTKNLMCEIGVKQSVHDIVYVCQLCL